MCNHSIFPFPFAFRPYNDTFPCAPFPMRAACRLSWLKLRRTRRSAPNSPSGLRAVLYTHFTSPGSLLLPSPLPLPLPLPLLLPLPAQNLPLLSAGGAAHLSALPDRFSNRLGPPTLMPLTTNEKSTPSRLLLKRQALINKPTSKPGKGRGTQMLLVSQGGAVSRPSTPALSARRPPPSSLR